MKQGMHSSLYLKHTTNPIKVSIMPRGKSALGFSQKEMPENKLMTRDEFLDDMCVLLGGRVAENCFMDKLLLVLVMTFKN